MVRITSKLTLFSAALLLSCVVAESPDPTLPVSSLLASADALLARGDKHGALDHFDAAVQKDPSNYLTLFKRGATYLSLGRPSQASADFDAVLQLKPDFEAALLQRARLRAKAGNWDAARKDYTSAGRTKHAPAIDELDAARTAADAAPLAAQRDDWEACIDQAGAAILVAPAMPSLRSLRARCRMRKGDVPAAVGDLAHVAQLNPSSIEPHVQIANLLYFSLGDYDRSTAQLRKCLHSDPDSKPCSKLFRRIKTYEKQAAKARGLREKRQWNSANKILLGVGGDAADGDAGVIADVKADIDDLGRGGSDSFNEHCPQKLLAGLEEMVCDSFTEMGKPEKARPHCDETLRLNPQSVPAILAKATRLIKEELFEEAIRFLEKAKGQVDGVEDDHRFTQKFQEAQTLLRRSKEKDYYKVLGVARDADGREIKRAYRKLTKKYHPDKYRGELKPEAIQTKMSAINEAYEVLSNPELRERFDHGDDPNSQERQNPFFQQGGGGGGHPFADFGSQQQFMFRQQPGGGNPFGGSGGFNFHF